MGFGGVFGGFRPVFDAGGAVAAAGNGLLNALIAYWPANEASGNLLDVHANGLHLADQNTVTAAVGLVYAGARQFTAANSEFFTRNDEALLSTGDVDFTVAAWVYLDSKSAIMEICTKWFTAGDREFRLRYSNTLDRLTFRVSPDGTNSADVNADNLGSPSTGTWYLVVAWHDAANNSINIQVNNGTVNSVAHSTGVHDGAGLWQVGAQVNTLFWNGRIGPVMFWKSAAGGGGVLSAAQRTALYNGGAGATYASFTT